MEVELIIDNLCRHEISKQEANERLLILFSISGNSDASKKALNAAVSAIYFNDSSDYLQALYTVVRELTSGNDLLMNSENIDKLYKELNP